MLIGMNIGMTAGEGISYDVVPLPQSIAMQKGDPFVLDGDVMILCDASLQQEAAFLRQYLNEAIKFDLQLAEKRAKKMR